MDALSQVYATSLALHTDLYQLTMAYAAWKSGAAQREAVFHLFYRRNPFQGGFAVACGIETALQLIERFGFDESDLTYLATLKGADGADLFEPAFLEYLRGLRLECQVDAVREGTVVFPHEPLMRVQGPVIGCMLLETALLNLVNFQTLIATKAARVNLAAGGESVLEFGLRRAQGVDGGLSATRASYVGGCDSTSNVLAGKIYGIPVRGTHAHSWVMLHDTELESFRAYAAALPHNCVFLVDTYDTLEGVRHAVTVGKELRASGHELLGIRLDSGDLAYLSIEARKILDQGGFPQAKIFASNELDEQVITSLKQQGATITVWGVGTKLATAYDDAALGGVYKLSATRLPGQPWQYRIKLSEQAIKVNNPGIHQIRRFRVGAENIADMIYDVEKGPSGVLVDPLDPTRQKAIPDGATFEDLLVPAFRNGLRVLPFEPLGEARARCQEQLRHFHAGIKRFIHPHQYPVGLEQALHEHKLALVLKARGVRS